MNSYNLILYVFIQSAFAPVTVKNWWRIYTISFIQVHLNKLECREKVIFSCKLFQKVKLSYILDSLHVK